VSQPEDLPTRVNRLEEEVAEARVLAAGADRDVSHVQAALRAHTGTLEALRKTQVEQGKEMREGFKKVDERFAKMDERFNKVDERFNKVDERFNKVDAGIAQITTLLKGTIGQSGSAGES
jgi:archaellum component FlaC